MNSYPTEWPEFYTATILEWKFLLSEEKYKNIIVGSLQYLGKSTQIDPLNPFETDPLVPFQIDPLIPAEIDPLKIG